MALQKWFPFLGAGDDYKMGEELAKAYGLRRVMTVPAMVDFQKWFEAIAIIIEKEVKPQKKLPKENVFWTGDANDPANPANQ